MISTSGMNIAAWLAKDAPDVVVLAGRAPFVRLLCREIDRARLRIRPNCAVRTVMADVTALVEIADRVGMPIEAIVAPRSGAAGGGKADEGRGHVAV